MFKKLVFAFLIAATAGVCAAHDLCSATSTDQLIANPAFRPAIKKFLGARTIKSGAYTVKVADRALLNMAGPPGAIGKLGDGLYFGAGCRVHDCGDKVAVVLACPNKVVGVGVVDYSDKPFLAVFSSTKADAVVDAFAQWKTAVESEHGGTLQLDWHEQRVR